MKGGYDVDGDNMNNRENNSTLPDGGVTKKVEGCIFDEFNR